MELTRIHKFYNGDTNFPEVKWNDWTLLSRGDYLAADGLPYSFLTYEREKK